MDFQQKLMRKVYLIWLTRRVFPVMVFEMLFVAFGLHLFSRSVFLSRVIQNAAMSATGSSWHVVGFLWAALWNTRIEVKMEILIAAVFGVLFLWSVKRAIVSYEMLRRSAAMSKKADKPRATTA